MTQENEMIRKYAEKYKGWSDEMRSSGWGEKFVRAKETSIAQELVLDYQLDYIRWLINDYRPEDKKTISELIDYIKYMVDTYVTEDKVIRLIEEQTTTPGMWAYLTAYYYE